MENSIVSILRAVREGTLSVGVAAQELRNMGAVEGTMVPPKMLRIRVYQAGHVKSNLALPPPLARMALGLIPKDTLKGIGESHIDAVMGAVNGGLRGTVLDYDDGEVRYEIIAED